MGGHGGLNILPQVRPLIALAWSIALVRCRPAAALQRRRALTAPPRGTPPHPLSARPQKRWNVYGREQRLKVARDEAKYEEEQAAVRERAEAADRERRRQLLLQRARQRYGVRLAGG